MTEEYASMKQIEFMKKLGFPPQSADLLKSDARRMINDKIEADKDESKTEAPGKMENMWKKEPVEKKQFFPEELIVGTATKGKEYHLSPEEVKCRALECAIEANKLLAVQKDIEKTIELADKFVKWINAN